MEFFDNQILNLFSLDLFKQIYNNNNVTLLKLNTFTSLLVQNNIYFSYEFVAASKIEAATVSLTININPSTTLVFELTIVNV